MILQNLAEAILNGKKDAALQWAEKGIANGLKPPELISGGLTVGLEEVGAKFECGDYYLPDMMLAAEAMSAVLSMLEPHMVRENSEREKAVRVVIGTVKGDLHSIGKDIVIMMLKAAGMEIYDLGVDVSAAQFVQSVAENSAEILGISALMTTTIQEQKKVIDLLQDKGLRDKVKVIVGGAPLSEEWANKIGADAYAADAIAGVKKIKVLLNMA